MNCRKILTKRSLAKTIPIYLIAYLININILMLIVFGGKVQAATKISDGTWAQSASPGTTTVVFTNTTALSSGDKIILTFPTQATINASGTNITVTGQTTPTRSNNSTANTITITLDASISGSTAITVAMTDGLTSYTSTTYAQQSVAITTTDSTNNSLDYGVGIKTNTNTTTVTASVPLFVNLAVNDVTMDLGVLTTTAVSSASQTYTVNSNNVTGVQLKISADAALNDGSGNDINDVADGTVTAGSEEYGISTAVSGLTAQSPFDSGDDAVPTSATNIANSTAAVNAATLTLTYKASIAGTTVAGEYDQIVTVTVATNN
ncbi:hypothetical protein H6802_01575 [Candidatus Nomurabacteria bacterium]|nr:hypothetical protein [Candidatus Nomurabacteria bacterium]MCB9827419.1 hypothetical protein [Candidatus Nomurabacteria bacterium]